MMRSIYSEDSPDRSHLDFGYDKRLFSGFQTDYKIAEEFELFGYTMWQKDKNREYYPTRDPISKFGHDEFFYGGGIKGEIGACFTYSGEYVRQNGHRYAKLSRERSKVKAHAWNIKSEYTMRTVATTPSIKVQLLRGSGDPDTENNLDTSKGNVPYTPFNAYTGYGYVNTGLVFSPFPTNMKTLSLGLSCKPCRFEDNGFDLEVGATGHQYWRVNSRGGISDRFTRPNKKFLGRAIDLFAQVRPFSDLSIMFQYGAFWPDNDPFPDNSNRDYFGITTMLYF